MGRPRYNAVDAEEGGHGTVSLAGKLEDRTAPGTVHGLRRTGSTILNGLAFNSDWIEKCLAHEDRRSSRGVHNKAEYAEHRRHMLQEWADIDAWVAGKSQTPMLLPPTMKVPTTEAPI